MRITPLVLGVISLLIIFLILHIIHFQVEEKTTKNKFLKRIYNIDPRFLVMIYGALSWVIIICAIVLIIDLRNDIL